MQRVSDGYTIIEVLIFLAVSGFLLVVSMTFLSGKDAHTRFSASMRDVQSKFQDWLNDVPTGFAGGQSGTLNGNTYCVNPGTKVQIRNSGTPPNNPDCIYLGRAIQVTDSSFATDPTQASKIYSYSVFGARSDSGGELVSNIVDANPVPVVGIPSISGSSVDFTDTYKVNGGAKVLSVKSQAVDYTGASLSGSSHLAGFYLSFNQISANRNGSQEVKSYVYNLPNNELPGNSGSGSNNNIDDCLGMISSACKWQVSAPKNQWPAALQEWDICFGNDVNSDTAVLSVLSSSGLGASTNLEFKACS
jgi:hypothetical protein